MVPELADEPGFVHGFSTLAVGSVGLKHAPDPGPVLGARKAFLHALDLDGVEVVATFDARFIGPSAGGRWLVDLAAANAAQLEDGGVKAVYDIGMCTKESYLFPSHRRMPDGTRFGAIVALQ